LGDLKTAVLLYDKAIEIRKRLISCEDRKEFLGVLAMANVEKLNILFKSGNFEDVESELKEAESILEAEFNRTGRNDFERSLEKARKILQEL